MRVAVIGDSISTRNNGASSTSWPELLESLIRSLGIFDWTIDNYSIPGLTWKTAHVATPGFLIGNQLSPMDALKSRGGYQLVLPCLGANDRQNPNAAADLLSFQQSLPLAIDGCAVAYVAEEFRLDNGLVSPKGIVTQQEAEYMDSLYATINAPFDGVNLAKLYDMSFTFDRLHPCNSGKQWIAASIYMGLQRYYPLTPIVRNIAWLYEQYLSVDKTVFNQMRCVSR